MIVQLTEKTAKEILEQNEKPVVIDVFAKWCGPCIQMKPFFEQLASELSDRYTFAELDVDASRELAINLNVTSVPTLIFIKNKNIVGREVGYLPKDELKAKIESYLGV
jgi:thioredoxin 1